jgi:hypothetical protein
VATGLQLDLDADLQAVVQGGRTGEVDLVVADDVDIVVGGVDAGGGLVLVLVPLGDDPPLGEAVVVVAA